MKKIKFYSYSSLILLAFTSFLSSCGNNDSEPQNSENQKTDTVAAASEQATETKLYSLPAPLQVSTAIKNANAKYLSNVYSPLKDNFPTEFDKMIHLGGYAVDLGYATVYEQKQIAINYFSTSLKLANDLNILAVTEPGILKRFKDNINNKDSVSYFAISAFSDIHQNLIDGKRADDAYILLTGSFIEGAYISCKVYENGGDKKMMQLIANQKLVVESLLELFSDYKDKKEVADLIVKLNDLKSVYDSVDIKYSEISPNMKKIEPIDLPKEAMDKITKKITELRSTLLN